MAIIVNGYEHRTLSQPLYVNGKQVMEAYANGVKVYPDGYYRTEILGSQTLIVSDEISWNGHAGRVDGSPLFVFRIFVHSSAPPDVRQVGDGRYEARYENGSFIGVESVTLSRHNPPLYYYDSPEHKHWSTWENTITHNPTSIESEMFFDATLPMAYRVYSAHIVYESSGGDVTIRGVKMDFKDLYRLNPLDYESDGATLTYSFDAPVTNVNRPRYIDE